jgi:hypothetical protein
MRRRRTSWACLVLFLLGCGGGEASRKPMDEPLTVQDALDADRRLTGDVPGQGKEK